MSEDDDLLRKLGKMARDEAQGEHARWDERWDRLAAGTLSAEEEAELRRLAGTSAAAAEAYEAFRPLGPEFHAAVAAKIAAQRRRGRVLPFPTPRRLAAWVAAAGTAAAAMLTVFGRVPPLPAYSIAALSGGASTMRGEGPEAPRLSPGDRFDAVLQPDTAVRRAGSLQAQAFLLRDGQLRPLELETERDASGAMRVSGTLDRDLPPGTWTLWLVVGRKGALPDPDDLRTLSTAAPVLERKWVALPQALRIQPRAVE